MSEQKTDSGAAVPCIFGSLVCRRTSVWEGKPCDEAEEVPFVRVDRRTIDDPMKSPYVGQAWYDTGRNHRVENGMIARDLDDKRWMVRIADGAEMQAFCEKYGKVILLLNNGGAEPCYEVEIYDGWRE